MTSKHFVALGLVVGGLSLLGVTGVGCGNSSETTTTTGTGGNSPTSTNASTAASTSVATTGTGGAGGTQGGGNHSFDTANDIGVGAAGTDATLQDPLTADYYKFTGAKGDRMIFLATAQGLVAGSMDLNDPTVADTVITLYDANKNPIAEDDDEFPRNSTDSQLFAELPADGDYYVTIEDCNSYKASHPGVGCADPTMIATLDYEIFVAKLKDTNAGTMQDGTSAKAVPVAYTGVTNMAGLYNQVIIDGNFKSTTDKHVFTFTPPADLKIDPQARGRAFFWVQPPLLSDGDGSTSNIKIWATDDAAGTHVIAEADQNNYHNGDDQVNGALQFSFPLDAAMLVKPYYLFVQNTSSTSKPDSDYYFIIHEIGSVYFGQSEVEGVAAMGANDTKATAETLLVPGMDMGAYFVDAQLGATGDVDWFTFPIPAMSGTPAAATKNAWLECTSARDGSGLLGFKAELLASDGTTNIITLQDVNPAKIDLTKGGDGSVMLPAGAAGKAAFLKISATGQDMSTPANTGKFYHCGAIFF
jgi:hypothetical protein